MFVGTNIPKVGRQSKWINQERIDVILTQLISLKEKKNMALSIKTKHQNQCNLAPEKNVNAANLFAMGTCKLRIE